MTSLSTRVFKAAEACGWDALDVKRYAAEVYGKAMEDLTSRELWETFKDLRHLLGFREWREKRDG